MAPKKQCSSKGFRRENFALITRIVFRLHVEGTINYAKTHGRAVWQELNDFLQSEEKQEELLQQLREGKLNNPVTVHIFLNMLKELKVKKKIK